MNKISDIDLGIIVGLMMGEGCIGITTDNEYKQFRRRYSIETHIVNTDKIY